MKKIVLLVALSLLPLALSACNTIQGVGADIQEGGQALDRAVK
jgi:predicted small secreted protein